MANDKPVYQCMSKVAAEAGMKLPEIAAGAPDAKIHQAVAYEKDAKGSVLGHTTSATGVYKAQDGSEQRLRATDGASGGSSTRSIEHIQNGEIKIGDASSTTRAKLSDCAPKF
jgi:hypothetical protein